jgi:ribosomal protein L37E
MKKMEKKNKKVTIRCRKCFMVDSYKIEEHDDKKKEYKCKHCGEKIYLIDEV